MKRAAITLIGLLGLFLAVPAAHAGESPDGAWVVRLEPPFVKELPRWIPLRIDLEIAGGKPVQAVASAIHLTLNWHPVDVSGLRLTDGRLTGSVAVTFQPHEHGVCWGGGGGVPAGLPPQVIAVDLPLGTITGAAPGTATIENDVANKGQKPLTVAARAWRPVPAAAGAPRYVEFEIVRWDVKWPGGDIYMAGGQSGNALLLRCTLLPDGSTRDWICLQGPQRETMNTADLLWSVENVQVALTRGELSGTFNLAPTKDEKLLAMARTSNKFTPLPEQALPVRLKARLIGTGVTGTAELAHATPITSAVLGRVRPQPFARFIDRTPRTWAFSAEADPALVAAAEKEASTPVRPGEPGKTWFWSESAIYGGYDIFQLDGKKVVAFDYRPAFEGKLWDIEDFEVYRAKRLALGPARDVHGIAPGTAPSTFNLPPIPGAVRYRFSAGAESAEAPVRHVVPLDLWRRLPANGQGQKLTIQGLDGAGQNVGEPVSLPVARKPVFQGPYFTALPRTCREAALLSARWMGDHPASTALRLNNGIIERLSGNGDASVVHLTYGGLYAGLILAQASPDPAERQYGLDLAITVGEVWMRSFSRGYLPDVYKGWAFEQWVYGTAWLDLYRLTGDPRWRELVMEHARRLCAKQLPSGTWGETDPDSGHVSVDATTGIPKMMSLHGPTMQQWDPSSTLHYLGRIRKELKTDDFRAAEDKAWQWLQENSIARFDWRRQGPFESSHHRQPWATISDCALHCYEYLALDLPGRQAEEALMEDLVRWCEEREVDWRRQVNPTAVFPAASGSLDEQLRLARAFGRQAQRTGSALWKAKAEALAGAMLTAQIPTTGQLPVAPNRLDRLSGVGMAGHRGEYGTMALLDLAELWEPAKP